MGEHLRVIDNLPLHEEHPIQEKKREINVGVFQDRDTALRLGKGRY
jgi:hypothetical protein